MKATVATSMSWLIAVVLCACAEDPPDAPAIGVEFSWDSTRDAGSINPKIVLSEIPEGTVKFRVEMTDLDFSMANHGGGEVEYAGGSVIETGAVKGSYVGPRPPPGRVHNYQFTVQALDREGEVIGIGQAARKYPPTDGE